MSDGYLGKCKMCTKSDVSLNYRENIDHYKEYDKERGKLQHRKDSAKDYAQSPQGKLSRKSGCQKWIEANPKKRAAQVLFGNWKRYHKETIPKDCEICKKTGVRLHAHHDDYDKPLVVRHLCTQCHSNWHKLHGEGLNG